MKKILPSAFVIAFFGFLVVIQMLIHGEKLSATKIDLNDEKFAVYESALTKLEAKTVNGNKIDFDKMNSPIVILNFWASWCKPCVKEFASLNKLKEKFKDKVEIVGINSDENDQEKIVRKMTDEYSLLFESVVDLEGNIASTFNITRIPASIVYHNGKIIHFSNQEYDFMSEDFISLIENKLKL